VGICDVVCVQIATHDTVAGSSSGGIGVEGPDSIRESFGAEVDNSAIRVEDSGAISGEEDRSMHVIGKRSDRLQGLVEVIIIEYMDFIFMIAQSC